MKSRRECNCPCHSGTVVVHPVPCCDGILGYMKNRAQPKMDWGFEFPLYVCLDDGEVIRIENSDRILYHIEAIDIENNEYQFWDAAGCPLRVGDHKRPSQRFRECREQNHAAAGNRAICRTVGTENRHWWQARRNLGEIGSS